MDHITHNSQRKNNTRRAVTNEFVDTHALQRLFLFILLLDHHKLFFVCSNDNPLNSNFIIQVIDGSVSSRF